MILDSYPAARTRTIQQAQQFMGAEHPNGWIRTLSPNAFQFFTNVALTPRLRLAAASCSPNSEFLLQPVPYVRHSFPIRTPGRYRFGTRLPTVSEASTGCLIPADEELLVSHEQSFEKLTICIPPGVLQTTMTSLNGDTPKPLAFEFGVPQSRDKARLLRQAVLAFADEINAFGSNLSAVALAEMEQAIIVRFLIYNAHNHSGALLATPPNTSRNRVERAENFIEENWNRPLDFEELSRVTNTSMRSLFRSFREQRGYSPADFAKQVRLEQARSQIVQDTDASIIAIAMRCGFQNVGRFANIYRNAYGELPSETRKRKSRLS